MTDAVALGLEAGDAVCFEEKRQGGGDADFDLLLGERFHHAGRRVLPRLSRELQQGEAMLRSCGCEEQSQDGHQLSGFQAGWRGRPFCWKHNTKVKRKYCRPSDCLIVFVGPLFPNLGKRICGKDDMRGTHESNKTTSFADTELLLKSRFRQTGSLFYQ